MKKRLNVVATIEARMGSSRLPGKVMKKLGNHYLLEILIKRLKKSKLLDNIVVATTKNVNDDKIVNFLINNKINYYRGEENNVNLRLIKTAQTFKADVIVQLTADNPFVDPVIVDYMINFYKKNLNKYHYVTNCGLGDYSKGNVPLGFNTQIFLFKHLKKNYKFCKRKRDLQEHPSLYFYREGKKKYKLKNLSLPVKYKSSLNIRLTVDTSEDLKLAKLVLKKLGKNNLNFGLDKIIKLFNKNNSLLEVNKKINQKKIKL